MDSELLGKAVAVVLWVGARASADSPPPLDPANPPRAAPKPPLPEPPRTGGFCELARGLLSFLLGV